MGFLLSLRVDIINISVLDFSDVNLEIITMDCAIAFVAVCRTDCRHCP